MCAASLDHLVGAAEQRERDGETEPGDRHLSGSFVAHQAAGFGNHAIRVDRSGKASRAVNAMTPLCSLKNTGRLRARKRHRATLPPTSATSVVLLESCQRMCRNPDHYAGAFVHKSRKWGKQ